MNYEDFKGLIGQCIQNPDLLTEQADNILENVKLVFDTTDAQAQTIEALKSKNDELRDTNVKLLMRQSFDVKTPEEEPTPKTNDEIISEILAKINS